MIRKKIIVFDMDETLGCFVQFGIFWDALQEYFNSSLTQDDFFKVLDKYPEFLRPNIISILKYVKKKKERGKLSHIYIYTNNQGPKSWVINITKYLEYKLSSKIFDKIIAAYKVRNKIVEKCRTTHQKTISDFLKCTKLSVNDKICFIDDQYHPLMESDNTTYINVKPYEQDIQYKTLIKRFLSTQIGKNIKEDKSYFINFIEYFVSQYEYKVTPNNQNELKMDKIASKRMMYFIQDFFKSDHSPKTVKRKRKSNKRTRKRRYY